VRKSNIDAQAYWWNALERNWLGWLTPAGPAELHSHRCRSPAFAPKIPPPRLIDNQSRAGTISRCDNSSMNFEIVIRRVVGALEAAGIRYALIGGFAMALRGLQRATMDLDFILMLEDMEEADQILRGFGYKRVFHSANVSHYVSTDQDWGRIDILHAFRGPTLGMLKRAEQMQVMGDLNIRVVHLEDIVGQARLNETERAQLRQAIDSRPQPRAPAQRSFADYLAFATFASRFIPQAKPKLIRGGAHWKL
jgi:hypothetical protein